MENNRFCSLTNEWNATLDLHSLKGYLHGKPMWTA
jgi:hypothetical protein